MDQAPLQTAIQIVDQQRTGLLLLDADLRVTYLNVAAEQMIGRSAEQVLGTSVSELLAGNGAMLATLQRAMDEGQGFTARQISVLQPDQVEYPVDCSATPTAAPDGLLLELHSIDAQLRMRRDDQHARQQETTRELTKGLAHEVKNPLGGIRGATQLLAKELNDPTLTEYTDVILSEVDRLRDLVDRMLGPRSAPEFNETNVHEVLERVASLCEAEYGIAVAIQRDYDPSLPNLLADRDRLFQACFNIVRNGIQAMAQVHDARLILRTRISRQVTLGQHRYRSVLRIDIEDNGPGVKEELKDRLFFPMISGTAGGTGLGLAMAQTIIGEHHGALEFESAPGQTIFTIYLPLAQPGEKSPGEAHAG